MKKDHPEDPLFELPDFDIPQQESPCAAQWSYEDAMKAFEKLAEQMRLREERPSKQEIPLFEM
jgi:hypothetical protein